MVALDANKAAFAVMLGSIPSATLHDESGLCWVETGSPDSEFNGVYQAPGSGADFAAGVTRARSYFQERGTPFHWELGLRPEPEDAAEILMRHGLGLSDEEPGMWLDLGTLPRDEHPVKRLSIRAVTDQELLRQWMWVWGCHAPNEAINRWYRVYAALPYDSGGALRMFVGFLDGKPAATVYLFLAAGVAAVHYVVTLPEFRRRGIGAAMTDFATREARAAGYRVAVLTASSLGINIYRRLGFQECCVVGTYEWSPEGHPAP